MRTMKFAASAAVIVSAWLTVSAAGERAVPLSPDEQAIDAFVRAVNGRWTLTQRVAGGAPQTRVEGWAEIELVRQATHMVGPRALGRFSSEERGTVDRAPYSLETLGVWEVTLDRAPADKSGDLGFVVAQANTVRASAGACRDGLLTQADLRMRLSRPAGSGAASSLVLTAPPPGEPRTFRGRSVPAEWTGPVSFANAAVPSADVKGCSREYAGLTITGSEMRITWDNGVRDVLKRAAAR
jgi:hypothetical protein